MTEFGAGLAAFRQKLDQRQKDVFLNTVSAVRDSIQNGSAVTGAPGQPVDTGNLKGSWVATIDGPTSALVSTNVIYAPGIEDGVGPYGPLKLRSKVGGWHSVKLTRTHFSPLVEAVVKDVLAKSGDSA